MPRIDTEVPDDDEGRMDCVGRGETGLIAYVDDDGMVKMRVIVAGGMTGLKHEDVNPVLGGFLVAMAVDEDVKGHMAELWRLHGNQILERLNAHGPKVN